MGLGIGRVPYSAYREAPASQLFPGTLHTGYSCPKSCSTHPGCQGNISPWWDVRDDRGRVLILESCQATQWVDDITGATAARQMDRPLQEGSTLRRPSPQIHSPPTMRWSLLHPWGVGARGCCFFQQSCQLHFASLQVWAVGMTASLPP